MFLKNQETIFASSDLMALFHSPQRPWPWPMGDAHANNQHPSSYLLSADPKNKGNHPLANEICHREIVATTILISAHSILQLLFLFVDPKKDISQLFNFIILSFTWYNILLELYLLSQTITNHHPHSAFMCLYIRM